VVRVNGAVVDEPGRRIDPDQERVTVRGRPLPGRSALRYFMVHKPVGVITTLHDPEGRRTVRELLPPGPRLYPVGRLDADTSGLLLVTNDGDLAHHLMHPRYGVEKRYRVRVDRLPSPDQIARLRSGVTLGPGERSAPAHVRMVATHPLRPALDVQIHEGRFHQVRRMCEAVGLEVKDLHRYGYGPLVLGRLPRGAARPLTQVEVRRLKTTSARPGGTRRAQPMDGSGTELPLSWRSARRERPPRTGSARRERPPRGGSAERESPPRAGSAERERPPRARVGQRPRRPGFAGSSRRDRPPRRGVRRSRPRPR
jgi:23S rRNA pseudouridine2605 synthase